MPTAPENHVQPIEGELIPAARAGRYRRRPSLTTARGVRRELAALYLELRRGEIDDGHARTSAFLLRCLLEAIRTDELEARIEQLEQEQGR